MTNQFLLYWQKIILKKWEVEQGWVLTYNCGAMVYWLSLYCTTSFNQTQNQVLRRFKPCSWRVGDWQWWGSLTVVQAGHKAKHLWLVNHITKTIHLHHHHHHHHHHHFYQSSEYCQILFVEILKIIELLNEVKHTVIYCITVFLKIRIWHKTKHESFDTDTGSQLHEK